MKRLISYSLVCLSLFVVFATINTYSTPNFSKEKSGINAIHSSDQFYLSTAELPNGSVANEIVKIEVGSETVVSLQNAHGFLFRIIRSAKLTHQQFISTSFFYSSHRALIQESGYYLFHLRKLLI
ncbi:MAG: hypothetical protein PHS59_14245 [Paludibacter sp.]|nr:hypothetical protein [Paludibacter sp.]